MPKTVDNDLPITDCCPGFGSVAKYIAVSIREAGFRCRDRWPRPRLKSSCMEVMGRHAGWIAAAGRPGSRKKHGEYAARDPLPRDRVSTKANFCEHLNSVSRTYSYCSVVVSEGIKTRRGQIPLGCRVCGRLRHAQLGGAPPVIAQFVKEGLGYKYHWAVADCICNEPPDTLHRIDRRRSSLMQWATRRWSSPFRARTPSCLRWCAFPGPALPAGNRNGTVIKAWPTWRKRCRGLHYPGRLSDITAKGRRYLAPLIKGRRLSPVQGRPTRLCAPEERGGSEKVG